MLSYLIRPCTWCENVSRKQDTNWKGAAWSLQFCTSSFPDFWWFNVVFFCFTVVFLCVMLERDVRCGDFVGGTFQQPHDTYAITRVASQQFPFRLAFFFSKKWTFMEEFDHGQQKISHAKSMDVSVSDTLHPPSPLRETPQRHCRTDYPSIVDVSLEEPRFHPK